MHQDENQNNSVPSGGRSPKRGTANRRRRFSAIEEAREVIGEFVERYNGERILERLGYRTPVDAA